LENIAIKIYTNKGVYYVEDISDPWQACRYADKILREQFSDVEIYSGEKVDISDMCISPDRNL
jgi:hypothetical protein